MLNFNDFFYSTWMQKSTSEVFHVNVFILRLWQQLRSLFIRLWVCKEVSWVFFIGFD